MVRFIQEWLVVCISWTFQDYFCFFRDVSSEMKLIPFKKWDTYHLQDRNQWTFISSETVKPMNTDKIPRRYSSLFWLRIIRRENELWLLLKNLREISNNFHIKLEKKVINMKYSEMITTDDSPKKKIRSKFVIRFRMTQLKFNQVQGQMRC